jgi:hypothetical protein
MQDLRRYGCAQPVWRYTFVSFLFLVSLFQNTHLSASDAAAALVGSLGVVPSVNAGDTFVMGEP